MKSDFYIDRVCKEEIKDLLYTHHYLKDESKGQQQFYGKAQIFTNREGRHDLSHLGQAQKEIKSVWKNNKVSKECPTDKKEVGAD